MDRSRINKSMERTFSHRRRPTGRKMLYMPAPNFTLGDKNKIIKRPMSASKRLNYNGKSLLQTDSGYNPNKPMLNNFTFVNPFGQTPDKPYYETEGVKSERNFRMTENKFSVVRN